MKSQCKNKTETISTLDSHEFIHYITDLIRFLYIFHFSLSNTYISGQKRELTIWVLQFLKNETKTFLVL